MRITLIVLAVLTIFMFVGCSQTSTTSTSQTQPTPAVTAEPKTITQAELGAPVYPGAVLDATASRPPMMPSGVDVNVLMSPDSVSKVYEFYKSKLQGVKTSQLQKKSGEEMGVISASGKKGGKVIVNISANREKKTTRIEVVSISADTPAK